MRVNIPFHDQRCWRYGQRMRGSQAAIATALKTGWAAALDTAGCHGLCVMAYIKKVSGIDPRSTPIGADKDGAEGAGHKALAVGG